MKRLLAFALLLTFALSACSGGSSSGKLGSAKSRDPHVISVGEGSEPAPGGPGGKGSQPNSTAQSAGASAHPTALQTISDTDAIRVNDLEYWGCTFRVGTTCKIPYVGNYALVTQYYGTLVFAAYENNDAKPAHADRVPIVRGAFPSQAKMQYTVGLRAKTVTFTSWIEGKDGEVLARGKRQTFPVTPPA